MVKNKAVMEAIRKKCEMAIRPPSERKSATEHCSAVVLEKKKKWEAKSKNHLQDLKALVSTAPEGTAPGLCSSGRTAHGQGITKGTYMFSLRPLLICEIMLITSFTKNGDWSSRLLRLGRLSSARGTQHLRPEVASCISR